MDNDNSVLLSFMEPASQNREQGCLARLKNHVSEIRAAWRNMSIHEKVAITLGAVAITSLITGVILASAFSLNVPGAILMASAAPELLVSGFVYACRRRNTQSVQGHLSSTMTSSRIHTSV